MSDPLRPALPSLPDAQKNEAIAASIGRLPARRGPFWHTRAHGNTAPQDGWFARAAVSGFVAAFVMLAGFASAYGGALLLDRVLSNDGYGLATLRGSGACSDPQQRARPRPGQLIYRGRHLLRRWAPLGTGLWTFRGAPPLWRGLVARAALSGSPPPWCPWLSPCPYWEAACLGWAWAPGRCQRSVRYCCTRCTGPRSG